VRSSLCASSGMKSAMKVGEGNIEGVEMSDGMACNLGVVA